MRFTKMHGIGNDYVYVNGFEETVADPVKTAIAVSDRHFGIGADGLIMVLPSKSADVRMRMFNADGSESEMCGNGIRCVAKFAFDHGLTKSNPMRVETGRGVMSLSLVVEERKVHQVTVNMGEPILSLPEIPVDPTRVGVTGEANVYALDVPGFGVMKAVFVSMGNPHVVIEVANVQAIELERIGPVIERHAAFPRRINVHFVQVVGPEEVIMRTWERGERDHACLWYGCMCGVCCGRASRDECAKDSRSSAGRRSSVGLEREWAGVHDGVRDGSV